MSSLLVGLGLCFVKAPASDCTAGNLTLNFPLPLEDYRDELFAGSVWLVEAHLLSSTTLVEDREDELFVGGSGALLCEGAGL